VIENFRLVSDFFGYTPNFHDSEICKIDLDRNGPSAIMTIYICETSSDIDEHGKYKIAKPCLVNFKFENLLEIELKDFNIQNVIFELEFIQESEGIKTIIDSSYGLNGYILCSKVSVLDLKEL
jgi:hypothetical protein